MKFNNKKFINFKRKFNESCFNFAIYTAVPKKHELTQLLHAPSYTSLIHTYTRQTYFLLYYLSHSYTYPNICVHMYPDISFMIFCYVSRSIHSNKIFDWFHLNRFFCCVCAYTCEIQKTFFFSIDDDMKRVYYFHI